MRGTDDGIFNRDDFRVADRYIQHVETTISYDEDSPSKVKVRAAIRYIDVTDKSDWEETETISMSDVDRLKLEEKLTNNVVKNCPMCEKATFQDGGCNYMKCSDSDPVSSCPCEWCFLCHKPKYKVLEGKEALGFCNEASHNSH